MTKLVNKTRLIFQSQFGQAIHGLIPCIFSLIVKENECVPRLIYASISWNRAFLNEPPVFELVIHVCLCGMVSMEMYMIHIGMPPI